MDELLWLMYPIGGAAMLLHPMGRRVLWWLLVVAPLAILALMLASEPDLGD